ncbi:hypothetical protein HIM_06230 [Hirsutella minnesotensis 3608]|uniref:Uncharacterized protein n=1 Tax=Hirsutella minnesotensis 3608 TaxID=1043627 RepID=A0A0F7ZNV7_9HYPO|nr:hypothetical protein HIM_06230 [Hirsutella minnesotensis 3608]
MRLTTLLPTALAASASAALDHIEPAQPTSVTAHVQQVQTFILPSLDLPLLPSLALPALERRGARECEAAASKIANDDAPKLMSLVRAQQTLNPKVSAYLREKGEPKASLCLLDSAVPSITGSVGAEFTSYSRAFFSVASEIRPAIQTVLAECPEGRGMTDAWDGTSCGRQIKEFFKDGQVEKKTSAAGSGAGLGRASLLIAVIAAIAAF